MALGIGIVFSIGKVGTVCDENLFLSNYYLHSNTTQSVRIDQTNMSKLLLSDYKRRCYGIEDDSESTEMAS